MSIQEQGRRSGEPVAQMVPGDCKKPLPLGLRGEDLPFQVRPAERHLSGARAFQAAEKAYNGGASLIDRTNRE